MTIIEFYDKVQIENVAGALLSMPERVVLVGDDAGKMAKSAAFYQEILKKRGADTVFIPKRADRHKLWEIVEVLSEIVETYEDCVFDLTGGEELYLVAVGIVMERYRGRAQCHRFNLKSDTVNDCDADGSVCAVKSFDISIEENLSIYGGEIVTDPNRKFYTYPWSFTEEFVGDVERMWSICRKNPRLWNLQIGAIGAICETSALNKLTLSYDVNLAFETLKYMGIKYVCIAWMLNELCREGLIHGLSIEEDRVSFTFKNEQVKQCLTVSGQILELMVACELRKLKDKDGAPLYHDIKVGVVIDWDDDDDEKKEETQSINEIDVIAMKGCIPVFISCKNGSFDVNELYKLNTVANRFGNIYAKKVLISTELDKLGDRADQLRARMKDIGIRSVENVDGIEDVRLERALRSLWSN